MRGAEALIVHGTIAAALAIGVAAGAYRLRALTKDGAVATAATGFIVYGWGGAGAALPLLLFFGSATALTKLAAGPRRYKSGMQAAPEVPPADAAGRRAPQVLANGAVPAAAIIGFALTAAPHWLAAFAGALAAVTADTWATEIGAFSKRPPVLITTGQRVEKGRSGAVSIGGTLGGMAGALTLALGATASFVLWPLDKLQGPPPPLGLFEAAAVGGVLGFVADSILGATLQARFYCVRCKNDTEKPTHRCGARTRHVGGIPFITNDVVNFGASLIGAATGAAAFSIYGP